MQKKFEFTHCFFDCSPFKLKELEKINYVLSGLTLGKEMQFLGYANISFDEEDKQHRYPTITWDDSTKEYSRRNTNCLVYDVKMSSRNETFDKLFLYQTVRNNSVVWYGYIIYSTEGDAYSHKFFIEPTYSDLFININTYLNSVKRCASMQKAIKDFIQYRKTSNKIKKFI